MKKSKGILLCMFLFLFSLSGCEGNLGKEEESFNMPHLVGQLREGILAGESQVICEYEGKAERLNEAVNSELESYLAEDYLCKNLLDGVDIQWEQVGTKARADIHLTYQSDVSVPVICSNDEDTIVKGMIAGWEAGNAKVTVVIPGKMFEEQEMFAMLDGAEINSASLACEADSVYYQVFDTDTEEDIQIAKMWLDFGTDIASLETEQKELEVAIQKYGEQIKAENSDDVEAQYRAVYEKILEITEYDDSIAVVTGMQRLSLQNRILRSAYGALVEGKSVCTGYARGFKALCDYVGLPCQVLMGVKDDINHSWNRVQIENQTFYVDCTAGDTGSTTDETFLFTDEQLEQSGYIMDDGCVIPEI